MLSKYWLGSVVVVAVVVVMDSSAAYAAPARSSVPDQNFGSVNISSPTGVPRTFDITNIGDNDLRIDDVRVSGTNAGDFTITAEPASGTVIAPNGTAPVTV